ncbi:MAG: hypothetical protein ACTHJ6_00905 [Oryzihumus sp.]
MPVLVLSGTVASPALADTWSPPPGAVNLLLYGSSTSSTGTTPPRDLDPSPTQANGLSSVPLLSIGHLPGPGTFTLSSTPAAGQVYADPLGICGSTGYRVAGTITVHEVSYAEDGSLRQIAAEAARSCGGGASFFLVWRWHSAVPYPRLSVTAPPDSTAEVGQTPWTGEWTVRNTGTGPLTLGEPETTQGMDRSGTCTVGQQLDAGQACTITLSLDTTLAHWGMSSPGVGVAGENVPAVSASASVTIGAGLVPPTVRVSGRTTTDVGIFWSQGSSPQDDPVTGYELVKTLNTVTTAVSLSAPDVRSWRGDPQRPATAPAGYPTAWSVRLVTQSGRRSVLSPAVSADLTTSAFLGPSGGALVGGSGITDNTGVTLLGPDDLASGASVMGVAADPDHAHLLVTVLDQGAGALWRTDLRGGARQVVDTSAVPAATFHRAVPSPEGGRAALSTGSGAIVVVDLTATPARASLVAGTGEVQSWSADGARLLVLGGTLPGGQTAPGLRWVTPSSGASAAVPGSAAATAAAVGRTGDVVWRQPGAVQDGSDQLQLLSAAATAPRLLWSAAGCALGFPSIDPTGGNVDVGVSGTSCQWAPGSLPRTIRVSSTPSSYATAVLPYELDGPATYVRTSVAPPTLALTALDATPGDGLEPVTRSTVTMHPDVNDADDPVGALRGSCVVDNGAPYSCPVADFTSPVLGQGKHTLTMTVADPAGHSSTPATASWVVDTVAPTVTMTAIPLVLAPSSGSDGGFWQTVHWAGKDNLSGTGDLVYDGRYRYAHLTSPWSRQLSTIYRSGQTFFDLGVQQGYSYCLSVRAVDPAGNVGPWSPERCTTAVLDDWRVGAGAYRGHTLQSGAYTYGDISTMLYGDYHQSPNISARRIGVVLTTCPTCGSLEVWQGKVRLGVVSGYSAGKTYRTIRWLPAASTYRWGQVMVKAVSQGKVAYFDGLVIGK